MELATLGVLAGFWRVMATHTSTHMSHPQVIAVYCIVIKRCKSGFSVQKIPGDTFSKPNEMKVM